MGTIWLIRHGATPYGTGEARFCGHADVPLTDAGQAQAAAMAARLAARPLVALYITPLRRTAQTAAPLAALTGLTPTVVEDLRELDWGAWDGLTLRAAAERDPALFARWLVDAGTPAPGGESLVAFAPRVTAAFATLATRHANDEVAVIAHACVNRVLLCALLELPPARYRVIHQDEAAINRIIFEPHRTVVAGVNDTCHLHVGASA
jgi:broad specificity phosphatase PhoE